MVNSVPQDVKLEHGPVIEYPVLVKGRQSYWKLFTEPQDDSTSDVCVCVRACVRACVCVCACACACACVCV